MAFNNNRYQDAVPPPIIPKNLPEDYVDLAEKHMRQYMDRLAWNRRISTTKIRNLLGLLTDCYQSENRTTAEKIALESAEALDALHVRMINEIGRDKSNSNNNVGPFVRETELLQYLAGVRGSRNRKALLRFYHYMEALVAYHKYMGGKEG